jgi:hypothetical protein
VSQGFATVPLAGPQGPTGNTGATGGTGPTGTTGAGFSTDYWYIEPELAQDTTAGPFPAFTKVNGTNAPVSCLAFTPASDQICYWKRQIPTYGASLPNVTVKILWYSSTGQTTGNLVFGVSLGALVSGDAQSLEGFSFAAETTATTTPNANAKGLTTTTITITGAALDSLAANDLLFLKLHCLSSGSTMTGNANVIAVTVSWPTS